MLWTEDGAVILPDGFYPSEEFLKKWKPDLKQANKYWPAFNKCRFRRMEMKRTPCGKVSVRYHCIELITTVSVVSCEACTARKE